MMRALKLIVLVGLLVAMSAPAWAYYEDFNPFGDYKGRVHLKLTNFDVGTVYHNLAADKIYSQSELDLLPTSDTGGAWKALPTGSPVGSGTASIEDSWGIFKVTTISRMDADGLPYGLPLWTQGSTAEDWEITGIFYGEKDAAVWQQSGPSQVIAGNGMRTVFFADKAVSATDTAYRSFQYGADLGPTQRSGTGSNRPPELEGVTDSAGQDGYQNTSVPLGVPTANDPVPLWTFASTPGYDLSQYTDSASNTLDLSNYEFVSYFNPSAGAGTVAGHGGMNGNTAADPHWGAGEMNWQWQDNPQWTGTDPSYPRAVSMTFTTTALNPGPDGDGWLVSSEDPQRGALTPELPSSALLLLGMFPVGLAWLRRRKED